MVNRLASGTNFWPFLTALLLLSAWKAAIPTAARAQSGVDAFREAVSVDVETQIVKTLETAREHIIEKQWEPAVSILQELIDSSGDTLVPVEPGRYWNTGDYCHLLISQFPPAGLEAYRARVDAQAQVWFESGQETLDTTLLRRIVESSFNSSVGDDALWLLGEVAFEQSHYALARKYWSRLIPPFPSKPENADDTTTQSDSESISSGYLTHPDPNPAQAETLARLVLCSAFEGDIVRARNELAVVRNLFPMAMGTIAGRTGKLTDIVADILFKSDQWKDTERIIGTRVTPGGTPERSGVPEPTPGTEALIWRRDLPLNRFVGPLPRMALKAERPSPYLPLVSNNIVFVSSSDSVFAFNLTTGQPAWPIDGQDEGRIFTNILERPVMPHLPSAGMAWYTLCASNDRLYARMGPPVLRRSRNEGNTFSEIVGLDIARREGELAFHVTSDLLDQGAESPEATSWSFEGPPLVSGDRVYVSARRGFPEDETVVACFDSNSSRLLWRRRICASLKNASDQFNLLGQNLLTLGDGRLFLTTGTGAIAALNSDNGKLIWVVTYESNNDETAHELSDPRRHGLAPCLFHQGVVYVAPDDSHLLLALDAATGQPVWRQRSSDRVLQIAGVIDNRLILCGQYVSAIDIRTGQAAWPQRIGFADSAGRGYGHSALSRDFLYWPTHDEILKIDHRLGRITGRIRLQEDFGLSGGNLLIADNKLVIAQPDGLVVLGAFEDVPEPKSQEEIKAIPQRETSQSNPVRRAEQINTHIVAAYKQSASSLRDEESPSSVSTVSQILPTQNAEAETREPPVLFTETARPTEQGHQGLWPVQRAWQVTLPSGASARFPERNSSEISVGPVITNGAQFQLLNPRTGSVLWTVNASAPFSQLVSSDDVIVFAEANTIVARKKTDGRLLWRRLRNHSSGPVEIRTDAGGRHLIVVTGFHVAAVSWQSGDVLWRWPAPDMQPQASPVVTERFPAEWTFAAQQLLYRPTGAAGHVLLRLDRGELLRRGRIPFRPSAIQMLPIRSGTAITGVDSMNCVRLTQLAELGVNWKYSVPAITHGRPQILTNGPIMLVVEDRQFATRLDVESGQPLWRIPIGTSPIESVSKTILLDSLQLLAVSDQVVRAYSLNDGSLKWDQYLGPGRWNIQLDDSALICIQLSHQDDSPQETLSESSIVILDSSNGSILQRLRFESAIDANCVDVQSTGAFVRSGNRLVAFTPWPVTEAPMTPQ